MKTAMLLPVAIAALLGGCQKEVITRKDSLAAQFSQLNKHGWAVGINDPQDPTNANGNGHKSALDDPNVRVIKGADFSNVRFNTNFQVDDPKLRAQMQQQNQDQNPPRQAPSGGMTPFGPTPMH